LNEIDNFMDANYIDVYEADNLNFNNSALMFSTPITNETSQTTSITVSESTSQIISETINKNIDRATNRSADKTTNQTTNERSGDSERLVIREASVWEEIVGAKF
ncbi:12967_t:CDS:2, partial [Racocetra fulgida]